MSHVIGVDIGGTKMAAARISREGDMGRRYECPTGAQLGTEHILEGLGQIVSQALEEGPALAVGVGSAGVIDRASGTVLSATDAIPGWAGTQLGGFLSELTGLAAHVENDVHAHARGEAWMGGGRGASSCLVAAIGTGVGGAYVIDGAPVGGARHVSGHIGHIAARAAQGLECTCGREGHLEAIGSGPALHAHYLRLGGAPVADARAVVALARQGNEIAGEAVRVSAGAVGEVLGGLANCLDPEVIVIGGGMAGAGSLWWKPMETALRGELMASLENIDVRKSTLGGEAPLLGAARLAYLNLG